MNKIEFTQDKSSQWKWRVTIDNEKIIRLSGQCFASKQSDEINVSINGRN